MPGRLFSLSFFFFKHKRILSHFSSPEMAHLSTSGIKGYVFSESRDTLGLFFFLNI